MSAATAARAHLDHIVVGIRDLDEGTTAFERLSGVIAVRGGQHPDRGTENALVSLGTGRYLELIAPRRDAASTPDLDAMRSLETLTVIGWAVGVRDIDAARQTVATAGVTLGPETPGSRVSPSGATLEWSTARLTVPTITTAPFFIRWKPSTAHPSTTAPAGCSLSALEIHDAAATDLSRALNALRVSGVTVRRGDPRIRVTLNCEGKTVTVESR